MKIRIKGNSLRLRLSQTEVNQLKKEGVVRDQIDFGLNKLVYLLRMDKIDDTIVSFEKNVIEIRISEAIIFKWLNIDEVGFSEELLLPNNSRLNLLIEKDFQCLTVRKGEDESDLFQNPAQAHKH